MRVLIALTCVLCLSVVSHEPVAVAQDQAITLEVPSQTGKRLTTTIKREYTESTDTIVSDEVSSTQTNSWWVSAAINEWHMAVTDGRPARVMRSFERLKRETESKMKLAIGDIELNTDRAEVNDPMKGRVLVYDIAADGTRKPVDEMKELIWEHERARATAPLETSLLPGKAVKVGQSWTVPGKMFELLYEREHDLLKPKEDPQPWERGDISVKLAAVEDGVATLEIGGELVFRLRAKNEWSGDEVTNLATTAKVSGKLMWRLGLGAVSRSLRADITRSGTVEGSERKGTATLTDERVYTNGWLFEAPPDEGSDGLAENVTEARGFAVGKVASGNIVLALNYVEGARLVEFNPATGKYVRALAILPPNKPFDHLSLSADRTRLAFSSTLNNEISIAPWNTFVLELGSGKINQLTPDWAKGDGLATELKTARTGSVTARVSFYDSYESATRTDNISATAQIDRTSCRAVVGLGGSLRLDNVPEGVHVLKVAGSVPSPRFGVPRGQSVGSRSASCVTVVTVKGGETTDLGSLSLQIGNVDLIYASPTWRGESVLGNLFGGAMTWQAGYPKRSFHIDEQATLPAMPQGFALSPNGKTLAISTQDENRLLLLDGATFKETRRIELAPVGVTVPFASRISWHEGAILTGGAVAVRNAFFADCPALIRAGEQAEVLKTWPEWSGRTVVDACIAPDGKTYLLIVEGPLPLEAKSRLELYHWDPATDTTRRLTSTGGVRTISHTGR